MRADQIAIQLYTLRDQTARDMIGTLHRVADLGYGAVEFAGFGNATSTEIVSALTARGLRPIAAHIPLYELRRRPERVIDELATIGCSFVIIPWLAKKEYRSREAVKRLASEITELSARLAPSGLRLGYHNHDFEFASPDRTGLWDSLVNAVPPTVLFELDVYWATYAGMSPAALIAELGERIKLLHMKDMAPGPDRAIVPPGGGLLPWAEIVSAGRRTGVEWYVVEIDNQSDPLTAAASGLAFLKSLATSATG